MLPWLAQSPDLNPIENFLSILKKKLLERSVHPSNADELFEVLCNIWSALPDSLFSTLVDSMMRRVTAVIDNEGCPTKYKCNKIVRGFYTCDTYSVKFTAFFSISGCSIVLSPHCTTTARFQGSCQYHPIPYIFFDFYWLGTHSVNLIIEHF